MFNWWSLKSQIKKFVKELEDRKESLLLFLDDHPELYEIPFFIEEYRAFLDLIEKLKWEVNGVTSSEELSKLVYEYRLVAEEWDRKYGGEIDIDRLRMIQKLREIPREEVEITEEYIDSVLE